MAMSEREFVRLRRGARLGRMIRAEFWPRRVFYAPLVPYLLWQSLRHGGITVPTAANPFIPHSGILGESKDQILRALPEKWVMPWTLIVPGPVEARLAQLDAHGQRLGGYPLVLKPDAGERGAAVKVARSRDEAAEYLRANPAPTVAQRYHAGPCEAGVLWVREPGEARGRIFSITDKRFAVLEADGVRTLREQIWRHPRFRFQAERYLARLGARADETPSAGERVPLGLAGNHCQGTLFADGEHLRTPALEDAFNEIGVATPGLHFGRFDVRYENAEDFRAGRSFRIIELNGALAESTNIYDPAWPIWRMYRVLFDQWRTLYRIGGTNAKRGARVTPIGELWRVIREHEASVSRTIAD
jgi:hypothetical protein